LLIERRRSHGCHPERVAVPRKLRFASAIVLAISLRDDPECHDSCLVRSDTRQTCERRWKLDDDETSDDTWRGPWENAVRQIVAYVHTCIHAQ